MSIRERDNRLAQMQLFTAVVEQGSFSAAAMAMDLTPSAVSKSIGRLEERLGARLLQRSTRRLRVTAEGEAFYEHCRKFLADLEQMESDLSGLHIPRGLVRINSNIPYGELVLLPLVPRLREEFPEIELDLQLTDEVVDLYANRVDIAVRAGFLPDSTLYARPLGDMHKLIVATPGYLSRHGTPRTPADLKSHTLLDLHLPGLKDGWVLRHRGEDIIYKAQAPIRASNGMAVKALATQGCGIARLATFLIDKELRRGSLVPILTRHNGRETRPLQAVFMGRPDRMPARVRAVLDFLVQHGQLPRCR